MPARYSARDIANWFLGAIDRDAGDAITHLKLQKLVYYAQAWSLALPARGVPLFDEEMQAWAHGPVAESLFQEHRGNSWDALPAPEETPDIADGCEPTYSDLSTYLWLARYIGPKKKGASVQTHKLIFS